MTVKKILSAFLIVVFLASSIYFMMPDKVRIDIEKTRTKYSVWENEKWVLAATEYVNLYDGTTKMRAKSRELNYWNNSGLAYVSRISIWKDEIKTVQTYKFKINNVEIEQFPIDNLFECFNCEGKIVHYEIRDILYDGETKIINSPFSFGHNMKIEWQNGAYYSKVFQQKVASDKIIIKYRPEENWEQYRVRLFDPPENITVILNSPDDEYYSPNNSVTFNCSASITGEANLVNISLYTNESGNWEAKNTTLAAMNFSVAQNLTEVTDFNNRGESGDYVLKKIINLNNLTNISYVRYDRAWDGGGGLLGRWKGKFIYNDSTEGVDSAVLSNIAYQTTTFVNPNPGKYVDRYEVWLKGHWQESSNAVRERNTTIYQTQVQTAFTETWISTIENYTLWTCQSCDDADNCNFASENRTVYIDISSPLIEISYPENINYLINVSEFDYSANDSNGDKCWYSNDSGVTNSSAVSFDVNFEDVISVEGSNTWIVYCNDTVGQENSSSVTFFKDTVYPLIEYTANSDTSNSSGDFGDKDWVWINVSVTESNIANVTFWIWTSTNNSFNKTVFTNSASFYTMNQTGLSKDVYFWNVTTCDIVNNCNTTAIRYYGDEEINLSIDGFFANQNVELGGDLNITATTIYDYVFIDVDHPSYGTNYSSGLWITTFELLIDWFRKTTFNDSSLSTKLNYSGTENFNMSFAAHQYDEVISMAFNISGENNPTNIQINKSNVGEIDRYYDGVLTGSRIYLNHDEDNATAINLTYTSGTFKNIYFQIDENASVLSVLFNLTGIEFGLEYYESYLDSFFNWADIDTEQTTARLDLSGFIIPTNGSKQYSYYDTYDSSINSSLWGVAVSNPATGTNSETDSYIQSNLAYGVGAASFSNHLAYVYTNNYTFINLWSSDKLRFRVVSNYDGTEDGTDRVAGRSKVYVGTRNAAGLIWTSSYLQNEKETGSYEEKSDADLNFILTRHNETHWNVEISGVETSYVQNYEPCGPTAYSANGVWNWTSGVSTVTCTGGDDGPFIGSLDNSFYTTPAYDTANVLFSESIASKQTDAELTNMITRLYPINMSSYYITNSSVYSNSIYDASGNIADATFYAEGYEAPDTTSTLYLSADNGNNWELVSGGVQHTFNNTGRNLKWRVEWVVNNPGYNILASFLGISNITTPKGYPTNVLIDFGDDGINDYNFTQELNSSTSPVRINISNPDFSEANLVSGYSHLLRVPVKIASSTPGQINIDIINITYDPNPVYLNVASIMNYLSGVSGMFSFLINIMSTGGNITIDDIRYDYAGGNDTIAITAHNNDSSETLTRNITFYYSYWDYSWVPDNIDYIYFEPISPTEKNVTAWGQNEDTPILNITNYGYGGKNATLSVYLNDTLSCVNMTLSLTKNKTDGVLINNSWIDLVNMTYLQTVNISLWADYECNYTTWTLFNPYISFRQCCEDCICSTEVI